MTNQIINCPNCGHEFALQEAIARELLLEKQEAVAQAVKNVQEKGQKELEQSKIDFELKFQEKLDEERKKISQKVIEEEQNKSVLKLAEKDKQIEVIKRQVDELKRKADQGSQQIQGEALESELENLLKLAFPLDEIIEIKKGQRGADITHKVFNRLGQHCGTIIWEAKNTANWGKDWVNKLKEDKSQSGADVMGLVTNALPENIKTFDIMDGVWVCCYPSVLGLATVLRENLIQLSHMRRAMEGQGDKMNDVYLYLISPEFKNRVARIIDTFHDLDSEIERERTAMEKIWKTRREQLKRVISSTQDMYAAFAAIIGKDMPEIESFTLDALPATTSRMSD